MIRLWNIHEWNSNDAVLRFPFVHSAVCHVDMYSLQGMDEPNLTGYAPQIDTAHPCYEQYNSNIR